MTDFEGMIIDQNIRNLIERIEAPTVKSASEIESALKELVLALDKRCNLPEVQKRYKEYAESSNLSLTSPREESLIEYPIGLDNYAVSFDPIQDEEAFWNCWSKYGFVVGKGVASPELCQATRERVKDLASELSGGKFSIDAPDTYANIPVDAANTPLISRGFFEVYHDDSLAQLRQAVRLYIHHVVIHGRADLWTSFDRYGVKLAGHKESAGLPLHVDQNPNIHANFQTTQGVLALTDCPTERGTFVAVPGSREFFHEYKKLVEAQGPNYKGEFVELAKIAPFAETLQNHAQTIPLRAGDVVSWDSRTTHANSPNLSGEPRIVAYISAGPARENNPSAVEARNNAFRTGEGSNVRDALMHASKKPRYNDLAALAKARQPEQLTALGKLLYGQEVYASEKSR